MKLSFYVWIAFLVMCAIAMSEAIALIVHGTQEIYRNRYAGWYRE